jgi:hypothetical protein
VFLKINFLFVLAFGFYSANDQFQARFYNLEGNYTFLNRQPVYSKADQDYLTHIVADIESKVIIYN